MGYYEEQEMARTAIQEEMEAAHHVTSPDRIPNTEPAVVEKEPTFDELCAYYKKKKNSGSEMYIVSTNLAQDDDMDTTMEFLFNEPKAASYDRYVKTASVSSSKAMKTFVLDNICDEQHRKMQNLLDKYPAMGISIGEKLLYMLGLSKTTTVRRL